MTVLRLGETRNLTPQESVLRGRAERLTLWNRLLHGAPVDPAELITERLCGNLASSEERGAYVALRACTSLSMVSSRVVMSGYRIAILYWFSNLGELRESARDHLRPKSTSFHLAEAIGARLTWDEAVEAMERRPIHPAAYLWLLETLQDEYVRQWGALFPSSTPASIAALAGLLHTDRYARRWRCARRA